MRVHVELAADVQDPARTRQPSHCLGMFQIFRGTRHKEVSINYLVPRRTPFAESAPVTKAVPKHKPDERVVDFVDKPPQPVEPARLKRVDGWTSDQSPAATEK